jgi:alkanesulfonate monooxygenase SsuD/methylene tetrahydromethanopterin reductase-like flavin-dependent oxidoreductase (luciferase family)
VPDAAVTDEYLTSQLLISGTANEVADRLHAFREFVGPFGRLLYVGHDWADARAMRRSMELMAEKVLPQL